MALTEFDARVLGTFRSAELVESKIYGKTMIQLGTWSGDIYITESSIVYGPYHNRKEWVMGFGPSEDVTGAYRWAVEETKKMMLADRADLVARLTAQAAE